METINSVLKSFWQPIVNFWPKIPAVVLGLIIGIFIIKILTGILVRALKYSRLPKALSGIITSLVVIVMWVLLLSEVARQLGMSGLAVTISGSIVILGLSLASGASGLTSDIISGIFLARDEDFELGYRIKVGNVEGVVQKVDIRKIRIIDDNGNVHVYPNAKLDKDGWEIISREVENNKIDLKKLLVKKEKR